MAEIDEGNWNRQLFAELVPWLEEAYPCEGCGLIVEDDDGTREFRGCKNVIDKYHELDPEEYPRTSEEFYMIDPREFMKVEDEGLRVAVIVHSHPDTGDYFSDDDVEAALMPRDGDDDPVEPMYPGTDYLVVSVREEEARSASLYRFDDGDKTFDRVDTFDRATLRGESGPRR